MGRDERCGRRVGRKRKNRSQKPRCPDPLPDQVGAGGVNATGTWEEESRGFPLRQAP
jgi:hypothetical protein